MKLSDYLGLLKENRFQIHPLKYPMAGLVGATSVVNSGAAAVQSLLMGRKIASTQIDTPPIFVIGHWRSGTTLMHELLALDERFAYPDTIDSFTPNHVLVTRFLLSPLMWMLLPRKRPMDDMAVRVQSPQEDDFALCAYGAPTPYRRVAFPNRKCQNHLQLNLSLVEPAVRLELQKALEHYLRTLTIRHGGKRLVLKSPPHTGRIKQLAQWFPQARFIHLARHPYKVVSSTMRLWRLLDEIQGFQVPKYDDGWLKNYVFECKDQMYQGYLSQRDALPANQLVEVSFEDLIKDPQQVMGKVYDQLELGEFNSAPVTEYFESRKSHRSKTEEISPEFADDIDHHWKEYMDAFGYVSRRIDTPPLPTQKTA